MILQLLQVHQCVYKRDTENALIIAFFNICVIFAIFLVHIINIDDISPKETLEKIKLKKVNKIVSF